MPEGTRSIVPALMIGPIAGVASGLLGVGGGIVMVPLLVGVAKLTQHRAHATSLAAIIPIALVGAATFALAGEVDYAIAACLAGGSLFGAPVGARLMHKASDRMLKILFGALLVAVAVELLLG